MYNVLQWNIKCDFYKKKICKNLIAELFDKMLLELLFILGKNYYICIKFNIINIRWFFITLYL